VIDCRAMRGLIPTMSQLRQGALRKWDVRQKLAPVYERSLPDAWNDLDQLRNTTKLLHFTSLEMQPWHPEEGREYKPHTDPMAVGLWEEYERMMLDTHFTNRDARHAD